MSLDRLTKQKIKVTTHFSLPSRLAFCNKYNTIHRAINRCGWDASAEEVDREHKELTSSKKNPNGNGIKELRDSFLKGGIDAPEGVWMV